MAKTSVLSKPLPDASLPRNSFDRSFKMNYNWSAGMLLPVFAQFVPAGSHCEINRAIFCRTAELNTAAFCQLDHFIDFFKVPLRLLMTRYGEFKTNVQDLNSSALLPASPNTNVPPSSMPYFAQSDFGTAIAGTGGTGSSVDQMGNPIIYGALRLLDLLGYNDSNFTATSPYGMNYNAFRLLAYQKVYYDHYRNTAYESNDPEAYNADYDVLNNASKLSATGSLRKCLTIRYHNYRKDFFQNIYPALNYTVSDPNGGDWLVPGSVSGASSSPSANFWGVYNKAIRDNQPGLYQYYSNIGSNNQFISVQSIRAAFALDKLMRASAYAPKHVKDQLEARFGVKCSKAYDNESVFLGSFKNAINIGEVTSVADTVNSGGTAGDRLGAIGGKGVGGASYGEDIKVDTFEDDCLIMGIAYTLPRSMYDALRVDSFNFKFSREDIFVPEFMDMGLRPVTRQEFRQVTVAGSTAANNLILGYIPRDQEYKIGIDENHGLFRFGMLNVFTNHTNDLQRGYTSPNNGLTVSYFKCYPTDLDSIFVNVWDPQYQITDQFFGQIVFKFMCRQNMSVHGQPRL